ncbi:MAG TPA: acyltransferase [Gammaproteobacteria bacterium]|nr:acyltransferase [Gammaproteobacteria bacterium]
MKHAAKKAAQFASLTLILPFFLVYRLLSLLGSKDGAFAAASQALSLFPGTAGSYLRVAFYRIAMRHCHSDLFIGFGTLFSQWDTSLGQGIYIGPQCNIGKCHIGADCLIGSGVHVMSGSRQHRFDDLNTPIREQGGEFTRTTIGEDCWIGNGALIMANIGNKCLVGAGAVVTSDVPDFAIVAGNPARVIRFRNQTGGPASA